MNAALKAKSVLEAEKRAHARRVIPLDKPTLPPAVEDLHARHWYALHTAPAQEWIAHRELMRADFLTYLPVAARWNVSRFRIKRAVEAALLTRYVFVGVLKGRERSDDTWSVIMNTPGVSAVLGSAGHPLAVPRENLIELVGKQVSGMYDGTLGAIFSVGDEVKIGGGPLTGQTGIVQALVPAMTPIERPISLLMNVFGGQAFVHIPLEHLRKFG